MQPCMDALVFLCSHQTADDPASAFNELFDTAQGGVISTLDTVVGMLDGVNTETVTGVLSDVSSNISGDEICSRYFYKFLLNGLVLKINQCHTLLFWY